MIPRNYNLCDLLIWHAELLWLWDWMVSAHFPVECWVKYPAESRHTITLLLSHHAFLQGILIGCHESHLQCMPVRRGARHIHIHRERVRERESLIIAITKMSRVTKVTSQSSRVTYTHIVHSCIHLSNPKGELLHNSPSLISNWGRRPEPFRNALLRSEKGFQTSLEFSSIGCGAGTRR